MCCAEKNVETHILIRTLTQFEREKLTKCTQTNEYQVILYGIR